MSSFSHRSAAWMDLLKDGAKTLLLRHLPDCHTSETNPFSNQEEEKDSISYESTQQALERQLVEKATASFINAAEPSSSEPSSPTRSENEFAVAIQRLKAAKADKENLKALLKSSQKSSQKFQNALAFETAARTRAHRAGILLFLLGVAIGVAATLRKQAS